MTPKPRILIVEDESIVALDLQNRLKRLGYIVPAFVASGEEAIAKSVELQPDLVLMDIKLRGEMDGIEAANQIKAQLGIPSIYLTAFADEETLQRAKATEPLGYLVKPFEERELLATIRMALYRFQAERQLRDSEQKFRSITEQATDGIFLIETDGRVVEWNPAQAKITGIAQEDALGRQAWDIWNELLPDEAKSKLPAAYLKSRIQKIMESGQLPDHWRIAETEIKRPDGQHCSLQSRLFLIDRDDGRIAGSVTRDVTESKRLDEAMRQAQKVESLGIMAGGAAHDFNNLLVVILGQASLALAKLPPNHPAAAHVKKAVKAAEHASSLTQQMLAISGRGQFEKRTLHFNQLIENEVDLLQAIVPENVSLNLDLADPLPFIEADRSQMQQILTNLVLNATEAIGDGEGVIKVGTAVQHVLEKELLSLQYVGAALSPGKYVLVTIEDNGPGMDAETRDKVFDPFFSTKELGRGLGLSAVVGIVRGHQGTITVDSEPGQGTTFSLLFPEGGDEKSFADDEASESRNTAVASTLSPSANHVLIIDDQAEVCEAVTDILAMRDIPVITAIGGQVGIDIYEERQAEIGLVLLDLSMPGMDGNETFQALCQINPDVVVVLSSGYDEKEVSRRFDEKGLMGFLKKPYSVVTLIETVNQCMGLETAI